MTGISKPRLSFAERRGNSLIFEGGDLSLKTNVPKIPRQGPRGPPTPSMSTPAADFDQQLTGSPPPPPTPAASPRPVIGRLNWTDAESERDDELSRFLLHFAKCSGPQRSRA